MKNDYICQKCKRKFKTRKSFYVCDWCAAITCKKCIGSGCRIECKYTAGTFSRLIDSIEKLKEAGYIMKDWE